MRLCDKHIPAEIFRQTFLHGICLSHNPSECRIYVTTMYTLRFFRNFRKFTAKNSNKSEIPLCVTLCLSLPVRTNLSLFDDFQKRFFWDRKYTDFWKLGLFIIYVATKNPPRLAVLWRFSELVHCKIDFYNQKTKCEKYLLQDCYIFPNWYDFLSTNFDVAEKNFGWKSAYNLMDPAFRPVASYATNLHQSCGQGRILQSCSVVQCSAKQPFAIIVSYGHPKNH